MKTQLTETLRNIREVIRNECNHPHVRRNAARSLVNLAKQGDDAALSILSEVQAEVEGLLAAPMAELRTIHSRPQDILLERSNED